jgi:hypothetical protein
VIATPEESMDAIRNVSHKQPEMVLRPELRALPPKSSDGRSQDSHGKSPVEHVPIPPEVTYDRSGRGGGKD